MKLTTVERVLKRVTYKPGVELRAHQHKGLVFVYVKANAYDADNFFKSGEFTGRDWVVGDDCDEDAVVRIAFMALKCYEEHETMEFFKYRGRKVFNPHKRIA